MSQRAIPEHMCCPGCRIIITGQVVEREGRRWHVDCWLKVVEARLEDR